MAGIVDGVLPQAERVERPYSPSWINRVFAWIESRPGPAWITYLIAIMLFATVATIANWMADGGPVGSLDAGVILYSSYPIYFTALMHYLDGEARSALAKFRPALQVSDIEYKRIEYRLTTIPAKAAWLLTAFAPIPGFFDILSDEGLPLTKPIESAGIIAIALLTTLGMSCFLILAFHTLRQLRMVSRIHVEAQHINLFQAQPVYAFSQLTARTGIGLMLFAYFDFLLEAPDPSDPIAYMTIGVVVTVAVLAFILPLLGMHNRLVQEKNRLESEINRGIEGIYKQVQERVAAQSYLSVEDSDKTLSTLLSLREVVAKLPTWPWHAETLRGFISALIVPILIWAITQLLEQFVTL